MYLDECKEIKQAMLVSYPVVNEIINHFVCQTMTNTDPKFKLDIVVEG
jgi:hypothetical protein